MRFKKLALEVIRAKFRLVGLVILLLVTPIFPVQSDIWDGRRNIVLMQSKVIIGSGKKKIYWDIYESACATIGTAVRDGYLHLQEQKPYS